MGFKLGNIIIRPYYVILSIFLIAVISYSASVTLRIKENQQVVEQYKKEKAAFLQFNTQTTEFNKHISNIVNINNRLSPLLGLKQIDKTPALYLEPGSSTQPSGVLEKITVTTTKKGKAEISRIFLGKNMALELVSREKDPAKSSYRANLVAERIKALIAKRTAYQKIIIRPFEKNNYGIIINNSLIFTITPHEAHYNNSINTLAQAQRAARIFHNALITFSKEYSHNSKHQQEKLPGTIQINREHLKNTTAQLSHLNTVISKIAANTTQVEDKIKKCYHRFKQTPSIRPVAGNVLSAYGYRLSSFSGKVIFHKGVDLSAFVGTPVKASADGYVSFTGWHAGHGITVIINHGYGLETLYGHLSKALVRKGQRVSKGQRIAKSGLTGLTTGPHLHYEVINKGTAINPMKYLNLDILSANKIW
ncbi:MAG: hypothetical protein DKM50_11520 [Candidatus Margulisiibacteriota bacterium]|nr:MAG: hypothetical protein A2X43_02415 [Candidatus Margulisbacteria bacterium GWD2_39_127]OGI01179.1 MAG: hypothetical protein A2X42_06070 [Candidatus Margulisbacteria bacterium GWF2_38_17]OGI09814.1 MAG: hypothetical protein A2X41_09790 [Candidatus Margulisbacteria bacterium GWE2_39_32]PZM78403.1 MAG: hypothetical protein DKM50_11520 [Candidatus Margulisiibacteriota bacterium]HAR62374.1 hypothetical protein [Candidatus Margulisiibacteriota bacterium]